MSFRKGDIILPTERTGDLSKLRHPAIVWDDNVVDGDDFSGVMITKSAPSRDYDNVKMKSEHFEAGYSIQYNKSHFVNQVFIKFVVWGPFEKVGRLTGEGIRFIEDRISGDEQISYEDYLHS